MYMCLRACSYISRALANGFPLECSSRVASLMAGEHSSIALLTCDRAIRPGHYFSRSCFRSSPSLPRCGIDVTTIEGGPWVFCLVPTVGPIYSSVWELSSHVARRLHAWHSAVRTSVSGSKLSVHGTVFESRAVICPLVLGMDSMFVRCVGQLAITVVLCGGPGSLPTRSATAQPCV